MRKIIINTAVWPCRVLETGRWFGLCMSASSDSCNIYGTPEFQCSALSSSVNGYATFQELLNDIQSLEEKGLIEAFNSFWVQVRRQCFCVSAELIAQIQTGTFSSRNFVSSPSRTVLFEDGRKERVPQRIRPEWVVPDFARTPCLV